MSTDAQLAAIAATRPGVDGDVADLERRAGLLERQGTNPLVALRRPALVYVGVGTGPSFAPSWQNNAGGFKPAAFYRGADGYVDVEGTVKKVVAGLLVEETIFTLPDALDGVNYRPADGNLIAVTFPIGNGVSAACRLTIYSTGEVNIQLTNAQAGGGTVIWLSLDGIRFRGA